MTSSFFPELTTHFFSIIIRGYDREQPLLVRRSDEMTESQCEKCGEQWPSKYLHNKPSSLSSLPSLPFCVPSIAIMAAKKGALLIGDIAHARKEWEECSSLVELKVSISSNATAILSTMSTTILHSTPGISQGHSCRIPETALLSVLL